MRFKMADNDYFSVGSVVSCITCYNDKIEGEVLAFDFGTKMLIIKSLSSDSNNHADISMVNLEYVSDVKLITEAKEPPPPALTQLNISKLASRVKQNIEEKHLMVNHIGVGVTPEGQGVFNAIVKTIADTKWDGKNIVVVDEVTIKPPYGTEDCKAKEGSQALLHVKKIIEKYLSKTESQRNDLRKSLSPSPSSSASSS